MLEGNEVTLTLSFHIQGEADNRYQTDEVQFDVELLLQQTGAPAPEPEYTGVGTCDWRVLHLENKTNWWRTDQAGVQVPDTAWAPNLSDDIYGMLKYDCTHNAFNYSFEAYGLQTSTEYKLIYYADPWPGDGEDHSTGVLIAKFTTNAHGDILPTSGLQALGTVLPNAKDWNASRSGAKVWLIPSKYDGSSTYSQDTPGESPAKLVTWPSSGDEPQDWLFEMRLIEYQ